MELPIEVELLGSLRLRSGSRELPRLPTQKAAALLAKLALEPGPHARDDLVELLWPLSPPAAGRNSLSKALTALRRCLEPKAADRGRVLVTDRLAVGLAEGAVVTDVGRLRADAAAADRAAERGDDDEARRLLEAAVARYRGDLLPDAPWSWLAGDRAHLRQVFVRAARALLSRLHAAGDLERAAEVGQRASTLAPADEPLHLDLLEVLADAGRRADALAAYERLEDALRRDVDAAPGAEIRAVAERLRADAPPAAPPPDARPGVSPLPVPDGPLFGREDDLDLLERTLLDAGVRIVTLTGPGGVGKTRLALEAAARLAPRFEDGARFVPLDAVDDPARIALEVLEAEKEPPPPGRDPLEHIAERLRGRAMLWVLDNLEQLAASGAAHLAALLDAAPGVRVIATSRCPLGLEAEREVPLRPLPLPEPGAAAPDLAAVPSVGMLLERARRARPRLSLDAANAGSLVALCRAVGGLPLGLRLVAGWLRVLSPGALVERIDAEVLDLPDRARDTPERHRTLGAVIRSSVEHLDGDAQELFPALSVFRGGFTLASAAAVCAPGRPEADVLASLASLCDASLVEPMPTDPDRYTMPDLVGAFAASELDPLVRRALQRRLAEHMLELAEDRPATGADARGLWHARLTRERDNLRAALRFCAEDRGLAGAVGLPLVIASADHWRRSGRLEEGRRLLEALVDRAPEHPASAHALELAGRFAFMLGDRAGAERSWRRGVEHADRDGRASERTRCMNGLVVCVRMRSYAEALELLAGEATRSDEVDGPTRAHTLAIQSDLLLGLGRLDESEQTSARCLELARQNQVVGQESMELRSLSEIARWRGDIGRAEALLHEALELAERERNDPGRALILAELARCASDAGRLEEAETRLSEAESLASGLGMPLIVGVVAIVRAELQERQGDLEAAERAVQEALQEGRSDYILADVMPVAVRVAARRGEADVARLRASIGVAPLLGSGAPGSMGVARILEDLAALALYEARPRDAATLLGAADGLREAVGLPVAPACAASLDALRASIQAALGARAYTAARARGMAGGWERALAADRGAPCVGTS